jgi:hypothetical protein
VQASTSDEQEKELVEQAEKGKAKGEVEEGRGVK